MNKSFKWKKSIGSNFGTTHSHNYAPTKPIILVAFYCLFRHKFEGYNLKLDPLIVLQLILALISHRKGYMNSWIGWVFIIILAKNIRRRVSLGSLKVVFNGSKENWIWFICFFYMLIFLGFGLFHRNRRIIANNIIKEID